MSIKQLQTQPFDYDEIISNSKQYIIPKYQRDYSWTEKYWEELWQDIYEIVESEYQNFHYLGYLLFQSDANKNREVIDGQQRLVTLSLLFLACIKHVEERSETNEIYKKRLEPHKNKLLTIDDDGVTHSKLRLNWQSDVFYDRLLTGELPKSITKTEKAPNVLLFKGYQFFKQKIDESFEKVEDVLRFMTAISSRLEFTVIFVENTLDAYKIFETLNARGVQLSSADLIKNHLFSIARADDVTLNKMNRMWQTFIENTMSENKSESDEITHIIQWYCEAIKGKSLPKKQIFKDIKERVDKDPAKAIELIEDLLTVSEAYQSIRLAEGRYFNEDDEKLFTFLGMKQAYPIIFASVLAKMPDKKRASLLKWINCANMRHGKFSDKNPNAMENLYPAIAHKLITKVFKTAGDVQDELKNSELNVASAEVQHYLTKQRFEKTQTYTAKLFLAVLEAELPPITNTKQVTLEHILSKKKNGHIEAVHSLGNFCLLSLAHQKLTKAKPFSEKKSIYSESSFKQTRELATYTEQEFTTDLISQSTSELAVKLDKLFNFD
ncbi:MAG: DUF262 domain-containing protein [Vampirovibrionales bacterium]